MNHCQNAKTRGRAEVRDRFRESGRNAPRQTIRTGLSCLRVASAALGAIATLAWQTRAQAQVPEAVYRDVKDVIEELMLVEMRHRVDKSLRCGSPNGIGVYYARSLEHLRDGLFGGLRMTLKDETIDLAADYVFRSVVDGQGSPLALKSFMPVPWKDISTCVSGPDFASAEMGPRFATMCKGTPADSTQALACGLALGVRATLRGNAEIAEEQAIVVLTELIAEAAIPERDRPSARPVIAFWLLA